jgi:hypothetical protein
MKLKTFLLAAGISVAMASPAFATSFGVRLGYPLGVQYSTGGAFTKETLRISANFYFSSLSIQGDYLFLRDDLKLQGISGLGYFIGAGVHAGSYIGVYSGALGIGAQVTGGLEYKINDTLSAFLDTSAGLDFNIGTYYAPLTPYYAGTIGINFKL